MFQVLEDDEENAGGIYSNAREMCMKEKVTFVVRDENERPIQNAPLLLLMVNLNIRILFW